MKKLLFFVIVLFWAFNSFAQNTLNVIDTGNITRERWRDSVLRKDMNQVPTGFLLEQSMFDFEAINLMAPEITMTLLKMKDASLMALNKS